MREPDLSPAVPWDRFDQGLFDMLMDSLLARRHPKAEFVYSPSDVGGDGGIDLLVVEHGRRIIYQYKFWLDDVTSTKGRPAQIEKSFISALRHNPDSWVLVVPSKLKDSARKRVDSLPHSSKIKQSGRDAKGVEISVLDRTALNNLLVADPEAMRLIRNAEQDTATMRTHLEALRAERITTPEQLETVMASVGERLSTGSAHWGADLEIRDGKPVAVPRPLHPHSRVLEPIEWKYRITVPQDSDESRELTDQIRDLVSFGGTRPVTVPGEFIAEAGYTGPALFRDMGHFEGFEFRAEQLDVPAGPHLIETERRGEVTAQIATGVPVVTRGIEGGTLEFPCGPGLTVNIRGARALQHEMQVTYTFVPKGLRLADLVEASGHAIAIREATNIRLTAADGDAGELVRHIPIRHDESARIIEAAPGTPEGDEGEDQLISLHAIHEAAVDLVALQRLTRQHLALPSELSMHDRIMLRSLRLVYEGHLVPFAATRMTMTLNPDVSTSDLPLGRVDDEGSSIIWQREAGEKFHLGELRIKLPRLNFCHPNAYVEPFEADARELVVHPHGDDVFVMYAPELLTDHSGVAVPWELHGVDEPQTPHITFSHSDEDRAP